MNIYEDFRKYNFIGNEVNKCIIESIYNVSVKHQINVEALHIKIINYMLSKREKSIDKYLWYLKNSKPIKEMKINCEGIENRVKDEIQEINALIEELGL